ncbi:MAG: polysaccharide deacetylase family protein [Bacteroidota bacterium]
MMKTLIKKGFFRIMVLLISTGTIFTSCVDQKRQGEAETWAEKLGFPPGKRVIILHADDAGMCGAANLATAELLENDHIQSTAVMVPCPKADEFIQWAVEHPGEDVGLHLTLTSEWKHYRWGPVSDPDSVPGLIDPDGMLWRSVPEVLTNATPEEIEKEIRAQIERSIALGYQPDHIDSHMGTLFSHPDYLNLFLKVAEAYHIPANALNFADTALVSKLREAGYPIDERVIEIMNAYTLPKLDYITWVPKGKSYDDVMDKFKTMVSTLSPGLIEIVFHPSVETEALKTITNSWQQRVWEYEMFSDPGLKSFFEKEGIIFTNWREVMAKFELISQ